MRTVIVTILLAVSVTAAIEKHFHYHFDGMNLDQKEINHMMTQIEKYGHKGAMEMLKCWLTNLSEADRNACVAAVKAKESSQEAKPYPAPTPPPPPPPTPPAPTPPPPPAPTPPPPPAPTPPPPPAPTPPPPPAPTHRSYKRRLRNKQFKSA